MHPALLQLAGLLKVFLSIYIVELSMRFFVHGLQCLYSPWVAFDALLVAVGTIVTFIIEPLVVLLTGGHEAARDQLQPLMVFRLLRLLRLARTVRLIAQSRLASLWFF